MPKKKNYQFDDEIIKIYKGYYLPTNTLLVVSEDKSFIKDYLEYNRKLSKSQYKIEFEKLESSYIFNKYYSFMLCEYYNLCLTSLDIKIIEMESNNIDNEIESTINKIKYFTFLVNNIEKGYSEEDKEKLISAIKVLESYEENKKKHKKIVKSYLLSHPIIRCDINEYFKLKDMYKEYILLKENYKYLCDKD